MTRPGFCPRCGAVGPPGPCGMCADWPPFPPTAPTIGDLAGVAEAVFARRSSWLDVVSALLDAVKMAGWDGPEPQEQAQRERILGFEPMLCPACGHDDHWHLLNQPRQTCALCGCDRYA